MVQGNKKVGNYSRLEFQVSCFFNNSLDRFYRSQRINRLDSLFATISFFLGMIILRRILISTLYYFRFFFSDFVCNKDFSFSFRGSLNSSIFKYPFKSICVYSHRDFLSIYNFKILGNLLNFTWKSTRDLITLHNFA